jgi:hypothetical protein
MSEIWKSAKRARLDVGKLKEISKQILAEFRDRGNGILQAKNAEQRARDEAEPSKEFLASLTEEDKAIFGLGDDDIFGGGLTADIEMDKLLGK